MRIFGDVVGRHGRSLSWVLKSEYLPPVEFSPGKLCSIVSPETLRALNGPIEFYRAGSLNEGLPRFFFTIRRNYRRRMAVISFDLI